MYEEIRNMAVEAVRLQNKLHMESTLNKIAEMCDAKVSGCCGGCSDDGLLSGGDVLVAADDCLELKAYAASEWNLSADEPPAEFVDALKYDLAKNWPAEDLIAAGDVLIAADGQEFKIDAVIAPKKSREKVAK